MATVLMILVGVQSLVVCLFIVELQGDHAVQYRKNRISMSGVDLRTDDRGQQHLVLSLERQVDRDCVVI